MKIRGVIDFFQRKIGGSSSKKIDDPPYFIRSVQIKKNSPLVQLDYIWYCRLNTLTGKIMGKYFPNFVKKNQFLSQTPIFSCQNGKRLSHFVKIILILRIIFPWFFQCTIDWLYNHKYQLLNHILVSCSLRRGPFIFYLYPPPPLWIDFWRNYGVNIFKRKKVVWKINYPQFLIEGWEWSGMLLTDKKEQSLHIDLSAHCQNFSLVWRVNLQYCDGWNEVQEIWSAEDLNARWWSFCPDSSVNIVYAMSWKCSLLCHRER